MIVLLSGIALAAVWLHVSIASAVGIRRVPEISRAKWDLAPTGSLARVSIIVPARNEEKMIDQAIRSLLDIDYPEFEVVAINDRSTDGTGAILDRIAAENSKLHVLHIRELPERWLGKTHAMAEATKISTGDWLLFTDADVLHRPDALRRAMFFAESEGADHVVLMPTLLLYTWGERMMISLFQALFLFAHRPWKVADPKAKDHIGVGAFNLVRRSAYDSVGGYSRLRLAIVDDMKLGEHIKEAGLVQRVAFGRDLVKVHWAAGAIGIVHNLTKNFFAELRYNVPYAVAASLAVFALQLGPWLGTLFAQGWLRVPFAISLACIVYVYVQVGGRSGISPGFVLLHPLATVLMTYAMLRSTFVTLKQGGVVWRGTKYSLEELRESD